MAPSSQSCPGRQILASEVAFNEDMELLAIKDAASSALVRIRTEESFAKALLDEYARVLK